MLHWQRILCPVDFSETSEKAMQDAAELARTLSARLTLLHVYQLPGYTLPEGPAFARPEVLARHAVEVNEELSKLKERIAREARIAVDAAAVLGDPAPEILRFARDRRQDLIVMGTHGRTGLPHALIGSVAERVIRKAPCPVLTVRPAESLEDREPASPP
jgi:nucleotide-binding universal stress UspA family protein